MRRCRTIAAVFAAAAIAACSVPTKSAREYYEVGAAELTRGDAESRTRAREALAMSVALDPSHAHAWLALGRAQMALEEFEGAVQSFTVAIALAPDRAEGHLGRAAAQPYLGQWSGSLRDSTRAIELAPRDPSGWHHRSAASLALGDLDGALRDAAAAAELPGGGVGGELNLGALQAAAGQHEAAAESFARAARHGLRGGEVSLWLYIAMLDAGAAPEAARRVLKEHRGLLQGVHQWPVELMDLALGKPTFPASLEDANKRSHCAWLYHLGQVLRVRGDASARSWLQAAQLECSPERPEQHLARRAQVRLAR